MSDQGVEGCFRFLKRIWRIFSEYVDVIKTASPPDENFSTSTNELKQLRRITHVTIRRVTEDIEKRMQFNTAIAAIMEWVNHLYHFKEWEKKQSETKDDIKSVIREVMETLILTLSPFAPHIAQEMAVEMNFSDTLDEKKWPLYKENLTQTDEILIVLQVNGKVRQKIHVASEVSDEDLKLLSLNEPRIQEWIQDKEIKKVIIVPKKLVNIVVK